MTKKIISQYTDSLLELFDAGGEITHDDMTAAIQAQITRLV